MRHANAKDVLDFLEHKPEQVSGVRDRAEAGAIGAEQLYGSFVSALGEQHPALLAMVQAERRREREGAEATLREAKAARAVEDAARARRQAVWGRAPAKAADVPTNGIVVAGALQAAAAALGEPEATAAPAPFKFGF